MSQPIAVRLRILDAEYQVSCPPEEQESLLSAARFLDEKMRAIRSSGTAIGVDRIAVIAGLNLAHELQRKNRSIEQENGDIKRLTDKIASALGSTQSQLEL